MSQVSGVFSGPLFELRCCVSLKLKSSVPHEPPSPFFCLKCTDHVSPQSATLLFSTHIYMSPHAKLLFVLDAPLCLFCVSQIICLIFFQCIYLGPYPTLLSVSDAHAP